MPATLAEAIDERKKKLLRGHQLENGSWRRTKTLSLKERERREKKLRIGLWMELSLKSVLYSIYNSIYYFLSNLS